MLMKALRKVLFDQVVIGMVVDDVRVPIELVTEGRMNSLEWGEVQTDCLSMRLSMKDVSSRWLPMCLDSIAGSDFGRPGLLIGRTSAVALEYLVEHWVCGTKQKIDQTVQAARTARSRGEPFLHLVQSFSTHDGRGHRHRDIEEESAEEFIWTKEQFQSAFSRAHDTMRSVYTPDRGPFDIDMMQAVVVPQRRVVGGQVIQGWDVMGLPDDRDSRSVMVSCDGGWFVGPYRRVDPRIMSRFERHGRLVGIRNADMTVWQNWVAKILVKVPHNSTAVGNDTDPECLTGIPVGKLVDARIPVNFAPDIKVVKDPAMALDILCRSARGYVMSGMGGDCLPPSFKKLAGRWLAVCVPVQWMDMGPCDIGDTVFRGAA